MPETAKKIAPEGLPTLEEIEAEVRRIAAEQPDFVYPDRPYRGVGGACFYVEENINGECVGSCLLGRALVNLGIPQEQLKAVDDDSQSSIYYALTKHLGYRLTDDRDRNPVAAWLDQVQRLQDRGEAWGRAIECADAERGL